MNTSGPAKASLLLGIILGITGAAFGQTPTRVRFVSLIAKVDPVYPVAAREKRIEGAVRLDAVIGKDGRVKKVSTISGNPVLVEAAKGAVVQWVYRPTLLNGEAIEVATEVCVPFVLSKLTPPPCATRTRRIH